MTIEIHRVTEADWRSYRAMRLEMLERAPEAFSTTLAHVQGRTDDQWRQAATGATTFQAREEGTVLGTLSLVTAYDHDPDPEPGVLWICAMYVTAVGRGRGMCGLLVDAALAEARHLGATTVGLHVASDNDAARRCYERAGFVATGVWEEHRLYPPTRMDEMRIAIDANK